MGRQRQQPEQQQVGIHLPDHETGQAPVAVLPPDPRPDPIPVPDPTPMPDPRPDPIPIPPAPQPVPTPDRPLPADPPRSYRGAAAAGDASGSAAG